MSEHSKVIEEYLLTLYKIGRSGEKAKAVTLANTWKLVRLLFMLQYLVCVGMVLLM